jgi:hypothetical protein
MRLGGGQMEDKENGGVSSQKVLEITELLAFATPSDAIPQRIAEAASILLHAQYINFFWIDEPSAQLVCMVCLLSPVSCLFLPLPPSLVCLVLFVCVCGFAGFSLC